MMLNFLEKNYKNYIRRPYSKHVTKNKIVLNNGSQVISRPVGNTGDSVRGFTGNILIIDEASRMPESVFTAAKPILLTTSGKIWMCSTPFGKQGYFYDAFLNKGEQWDVFHISSEKVMKEREISDSWTEEQRDGALRMLEAEKKDMGTIAYSQEYLGMFMDDLRRFFSDEIIAKCCILKRTEKQNKQTIDSPFNYIPPKFFMGCDLARMGGDAITYEIIEKRSKTDFIHRENVVEIKKLTTHTHDKIIQLNKQWDLKKIGLDVGAGAIGVGIWDWLLKEPSVNSRIVALNNRKVMLDKFGESSRALLKEDMYQLLLSAMERGIIKLLNDEDLIISLRSVQIEIVQKEGAHTRVKIYGRDTHIVEGLIRAFWVANEKHLNAFISFI